MIGCLKPRIVNGRNCVQARDHVPRGRELQLLRLLGRHPSSFQAFRNFLEPGVDITKQSVDADGIVLGHGSRSFGIRGALRPGLLLRGRRDYSKNDESEEQCIFHFVLPMSNNLHTEFSPLLLCYPIKQKARDFAGCSIGVKCAAPSIMTSE